MIIVETILATTLLATVPKRPRDWSELHYISDGKTVSNCFEASNGMSLERKLAMDIENIDGVGQVVIKQAGNTYQVDVVMNTYDFASYEKVVQKELELLDTPGARFTFNVTFSERATNPSAVLNAA